MLNLVLQGLLLVGLLVLGGSLGIWANRVLPAWVTPALAGVAVVVGILSTIRLGGKDRWLEMVARWADALIGKNPLFGATAAVLMLAIAVGLLLDIKRRSDADELKPNFAFQIHAAHRPLANVEVSAKPVGQDEAQATTARTDGDGVAQMRLAIDVANLIRVIRMMNGERRSANLDPPQVGKAQMQSIDYDLTLITAEQWSPLGQEVPLNFAQFPPRVVSAQPLSVTPHERVAAYAPWGLPGAERILVRRFSVLGYDLRWRAPVWVAFKLDEQRAGPNVDRSWRDSFRVDADLPTDAQPQRKDFVRSGYDIGSLIRRTDARIAGPDAIREYFLLSSVVPQTPASNRVTWLAVEEYTTRASAQLGPIYVIAGPVFPAAQSGPVSVLMIAHTIPVPTHLFRILAREQNGKVEAQAFLVPNVQVEQRDPLKFVTSIDHIERMTGLNFFPEMSASAARAIKASTVNSRWAP